MKNSRCTCIKCLVVRAGCGHLLRSSDAEVAMRCVYGDRICPRQPGAPASGGYSSPLEDDRSRRKEQFTNWWMNRRKQ